MTGTQSSVKSQRRQRGAQWSQSGPHGIVYFRRSISVYRSSNTAACYDNIYCNAFSLFIFRAATCGVPTEPAGNAIPSKYDFSPRMLTKDGRHPGQGSCFPLEVFRQLRHRLLDALSPIPLFQPALLRPR